jgi:hypothetical protein
MPRGVYPRKRRSVQTDRPTDRPTDRVFPVSAIDYPALLAQLEQQDRALGQEREDLAVIIAAVRKRARVITPSELQRPPVRNGKRLKRAATTAKVTEAQWAEARRLWDAGTAGDEIGRKLGITGVSVREHAKRYRWPARKRNYTSPPAPTATKAGPAPKGTQLAGSVKCTNPDCGVMTDFDPCRRCGVALKRKGW